MRAIHKRSDGPFLRGVTALLFLAACAWGGAAVHALIRAPVRPAAEPGASGLALQGICLRREAPLCLAADAALCVEDGERVPAGGLLARLSDGTSVRADAPAVFFAGFDGLETLEPGMLEPFDVPCLHALLHREPESPPGCRGRLVSDSVWYYAALAPAGDAPPEPGFCRLRFAGEREWLSARLLAVSEAEAGERALLFRLSRGGDYLSLRRVEAVLYLAV